MNKIKIKFIQLFAFEDGLINIFKLNNSLNTLLTYKAKKAALKYDIEIKLKKAVDKALTDFEQLRVSLCKELSNIKKITFKNGGEEETYYKVEPLSEKNKRENDYVCKVNGVDFEGEISQQYDIVDMNEFDKRIKELLMTEIELDCYPIDLSKLEAEGEIKDIEFTGLENFIEKKS